MKDGFKNYTFLEKLPTAKLESRFFATLFDYGFFFFLNWSFIFFFGESNNAGEYTISGALNLIPLVFWFVYFIIVESIFSATIGHMLFDLKVMGEDNGRIGFIEALLRHIVDPIDFFFFGIPAMICITNTPKKQRIGDLLAKTIVVVENND